MCLEVISGNVAMELHTGTGRLGRNVIVAMAGLMIGVGMAYLLFNREAILRPELNSRVS